MFDAPMSLLTRKVVSTGADPNVQGYNLVGRITIVRFLRTESANVLAVSDDAERQVSTGSPGGPWRLLIPGWVRRSLNCIASANLRC